MKIVEPTTRNFILLGIAGVLFGLFVKWRYDIMTFDPLAKIYQDGCLWDTEGSLEYTYIGNHSNFEKPLVVFLPGFGLTCKYIEDLATTEMMKYYDVMSISPPGFGGSGRVPFLSYSQLQNTYERFIGGKGQDREVIIVGNSVGGLYSTVFLNNNIDDEKKKTNDKLNIKQIQFLCPGAPAYVDDEFPIQIDSIFSKMLISILGWVSFKYPRIAYKIFKVDDCLTGWGEERIDALVTDARRSGSFQMKGFYDTIRFIHSPLDFGYEKSETNLFFAFAKKDSACGKNHQQWYKRRYGLEEEDIYYMEEGHCGCLRNFEQLFFEGVSRLV